tara:strand:- start:2768 stop:3136 length:369 start_codon:yes stop_codon:yes gene_type:complete
MSEAGQGQLQNYSVDQAAGAVVLVLGAVASLLLVIWQSKCMCKMNLCYIFQCERRPPSEEEMEGLKDQFKKNEKKEDEILEKEEEILDNVVVDEKLIPVKTRSPSAPPPEDLEYVEGDPRHG